MELGVCGKREHEKAGNEMWKWILETAMQAI
jgi:hypothetical protein